MRIGIDISQIVYQGTGVGRFVESLVSTICSIDASDEWVFFFSGFHRSLNPKIKNKIRKKGARLIIYRFPPAALSFIWNTLHILPIERFVGELDWFITSDWTEPPSKIKKATIIHDLVCFRYPETVDTTILKTQQKRLRWVKKESTVVFADSMATQIDIQKYLSIPESKIHVIYPGVDIAKPTTTVIKQVLKKHNLTKPFILTVGKREPRKNFERLITAFDSLPDKSTDLVVVGPTGWGNDPIFRSINRSNIHITDFIPDEELQALYSSCLFFIMPSVWEGFGIPLVEAMKHAVATACSDTSSLKEIGNNASLLFDPHNTLSIQNAMNILIHDETKRHELSRKGLEKSKMFTWESYYKKFITSLVTS